MNEEREDGITFGEICHLVKKRIWAIMLASVLVTAIAVMVVALFLNPGSTYYSMTFALASPAASTQQYADGTPFYYRNIISKDALNAAKASDERLSDVDINEMLENDDITISSATDGETSSLYLGVYTIQVKGSYFADADLARVFISAVAEEAVVSLRAKAETLDYTVDSAAYYAASLEERLAMLTQLRTTLITSYDTWISRYSSAYSVQVGETGKTLGNYRAEASVIFGTSLQSSLEELCTRGGFGSIVVARSASDESIESAVSLLRDELKAEYELNDRIIESFKEVTGVAGMAGSSLVEEYIVRNATIATQLGDYVTSETDEGGGTLNAESVKSFAQTLDAQYASLSAAAETLKQVTTAIYESNTWVTYQSRSPETTGSVSVVLVGVAAFVVAFLVAAVIVCATDYPKYRAKQAKAREEAQNSVQDGVSGKEPQDRADEEKQ